MDYLSNNIEKFDKILKIRGEQWPERGNAWKAYDSEVKKFYSFLINNLNFKSDNIDESITQKLNEIENKAIFICGNEKSGTTLLTQLLDGHKNIFSLPGDSHYVNKFYDSGSHNINKISEYWLSRLINPTGQEPFFPYGKHEKTYQNFINYLHYYIKIEKKETFKSIVLSFIAATKNEKIEDYMYWCEKTPLNELQTKKIIAKFPDAKFINILRNPVQNILSLNRLDKFRKRKPNITKRALFQVYLKKQTTRNQELIKDYKVINYEYLVSDPKSQTKSICEFLNIDFSDIIIKPTINSIPATANSMYKKGRVTGEIISKKNQKERLTELSKKEKRIIVNMLSVEKTFKDTMFCDFPELRAYKNIFYKIIAKFTFIIYNCYRRYIK